MGNIWSILDNNHYDENLYIRKFSSNEKTGYNFYDGFGIWSTLRDIKARGELSDLMLACALGTKHNITVLTNESDVNKKNKNGFTALMFAGAFRDSDVVKFLIKNGANVNDSSQEGFTPLLLACLFRNYENVVTLLRNGADVNVKCYNGMDSLSIASSIGQMDIVDILMEYGANINTIDDNGNTLLMQTLKNNSIWPLFEQLTVSGFLFANFGGYIRSAKDDTCKEIKHLVAMGANVSSKNNDGESAIILSTTIRLNKEFYCLIELGADINDVTNDGQTPLTISLKNGNKELSKFLIEHGANVNVVDKRGQSALDIACIFSQPDTILEMLEAGAQAGAGTPLISACQFQKGNIIKILMELGANVNETNDLGDTPLIVACRHQKGDVVKMLLESGASPNAVNMNGDTPLTMACISQNEEIMGILIELAGGIERFNKEGNNSLMIAFRYRDIEISLFLIEKGADPSSLRFLEFEQYKAIHIAAKQNDIKKVQLCLDLGINVDEITLETKRSALYYATKREYLDIMELLIVNGANIYLNDEPRDDRYPFSPLRLAIRNYYDLDVVKLFELSPMFDPYYVLLDPWAAFEYVKYFLKGDVDINAQNQCGGTMLHNAVFQKNKRLIDFLLKMGARTDIVDDYGNTAMNVNAICWEHGGAYRF